MVEIENQVTSESVSEFMGVLNNSEGPAMQYGFTSDGGSYLAGSPIQLNIDVGESIIDARSLVVCGTATQTGSTGMIHNDLDIILLKSIKVGAYQWNIEDNGAMAHLENYFSGYKDGHKIHQAVNFDGGIEEAKETEGRAQYDSAGFAAHEFHRQFRLPKSTTRNFQIPLYKFSPFFDSLKDNVLVNNGRKNIQFTFQAADIKGRYLALSSSTTAVEGINTLTNLRLCYKYSPLQMDQLSPMIFEEKFLDISHTQETASLNTNLKLAIDRRISYDHLKLCISPQTANTFAASAAFANAALDGDTVLSSARYMKACRRAEIRAVNIGIQIGNQSYNINQTSIEYMKAEKQGGVTGHIFNDIWADYLYIDLSKLPIQQELEKMKMGSKYQSNSLMTVTVQLQETDAQYTSTLLGTWVLHAYLHGKKPMLLKNKGEYVMA